MLEKFRVRKEFERMESIVYRVKKYLGFELEHYFVRRCYKTEEWRPFKLHRNCIPLKGQTYCVDFGSKRVFVTFSDSNYRCYVISFLSDFELFVERLCKLYSTACYVYSFCPC